MSKLKVNTHPFAKEVKDKTLSIRLTEAADTALEALAESVGITKNRYISKLIEIHLMELEKAGELPAVKAGKKSKLG